MKAEPIASRLYAQTVVEHERRLPEAGEVLVSRGDWVQGDDIVARCRRPGQLRVVDVAGTLGVPIGRAGRCLRVAIGQEVQPEEVLAATGFMGWRTVRAPVAGRVAEVVAGRIFIEEPPQVVEVRACLPGQVSQVIPQWGAVIRATVSRVVGVWGSGGTCSGPLLLRARSGADTLQWIGIDLACRGRIVVGGRCLDQRVLLRAARFRVLGLVVGGLAEHLRARVKELGLPVVVTDGLGAVPMAGPVFELLAQHDGRQALLSGGRAEPAPEPPALSIPLSSVRGPVNVAPERPLAVGDRVRLTRAPYLGAVGWVLAIDEVDGETRVGVRLDDGEQATVDYRNVERLS
ncbi:MAG: hypothetical protein QME94_06285 [Anaerolineae bacterium]|nr:hypothetical protein [Anaerolineae bacterium]